MNVKVAFQMLSVSVVLLLGFGCATGQKGPSDRELIMNTMNEWKAGLIAKNADQAGMAYSEDFTDGEGRGKAQMLDFLKEAISMGYLDSLTVDLDSAQITINDGNATVSPVTLSSSAGAMNLNIALKKEGDVWRIVGSSEA